MKLLYVVLFFACACASKPKDDLDQFNQIKSDISKSFHSTSKFGFPAFSCLSTVGGETQNEFKLLVRDNTVHVELTGSAYRSLNSDYQKAIVERLSTHLKPLVFYAISLPEAVNSSQYKQTLAERNRNAVLVGEKDWEGNEGIRLEIDPKNHLVEQDFKVKGVPFHTQYAYSSYNGVYLLSEMETLVGAEKVRISFKYNDAEPLAVIKELKITSKGTSYDEKSFLFDECKLLKREELTKDYH